jgi:hypothetical protein
MAVSQSQIVDLLYKEAFGVTKTDTATNKSPSNESIPSPALNRGDTVWTQSDQIPGTAAATAGIVEAYVGVDAVQCSADNTTVPIGGIYPTWLTNLTYWIPTEFGSTYNVQVWVDSPGVADPTATGTQIFADGSGGNGQYYYNYQSGVLNFIGETIPASLTSGKVLYIVGYRYIGLVGVTNLPSGTDIGNLSFTNSNISSTQANANINLTPNGTGVITSSANVYAPTFFGNLQGNISGNITVGGSNTQVLFNDDGLIGANGNFTFDKANALLTVAGAISVTGNASIGGNLDLNTSWINNVGYPNLSTDAATKLYVDNMVSTALAYHEPVLVATTTDLDTATGGTVSYNNGTAGVGANLTTTGTFLLIDGANVQTVGTRILVKNEANAAWNGVYEYTSTTVITRTTDADEYGPDSSEQLSINDYFFTTGGVVNEGHAFVVNSPAGTITFGTSNITFALFSQAQVYDAGTGIAITGTTISTTANQSHVTAVGTLTSLSVSGNANIGNIGTAGLITATGNLNAGNLITGGVVSATGNGTFGNIDTAGLASVTGNITGGNLITGGVVSATGNITGANLVTGGVLTVTGNANIGNIGTGGLILATGNITGGNLITGGVVTATGNISGANLVASYGVDTANLTVSANANIGNIGTGGLITATGNIDGGNLNTGGVVSATGNITGANIITGGIVSATGNATVGNITTTGLANVGSLTVTGVSNLGPISNVTITGGSANYLLQTNGSGALTWVAPPSTSSIVNGTSNVSIPTANGNVNTSVGGNANVFVVTGTGANVTGTFNATGNLDAGNIITAGIVSATGNGTFGNISTTGSGGNISGANVVSANTFTATANITGGNLVTGGVVTATGNITGGNLTTAGVLSVTGNANIGNIGTAGLITATGNIQGANLVTGGVLSVTGNANIGNIGTAGVITATGNITGGNINTANAVTANTIVANVSANIGNTQVGWGTVTTTAITANQTIVEFSTTGIAAIEFLVKGEDSAGDKYSVATVTAVTDGTNVDFATYATAFLTSGTGALAVNISGGNVALQVTPSSSNSTVWTTQYRVM